MRTAPQGSSVALPLGPRSAVLGEGDACGLRHGSLRWSPYGATAHCTGPVSYTHLTLPTILLV
eukprot:8452369-Pyramimonas_sp.AAC.1